MKKVLKLFAVAMMLGTTVPTMAQTESFTDQTRFVVAKGNGSINIRKAPNTKAQKVGSISSDETLRICQTEWYGSVREESTKIRITLRPDVRTGTQVIRSTDIPVSIPLAISWMWMALICPLAIPTVDVLWAVGNNRLALLRKLFEGKDVAIASSFRLLT